MTDPQQASPTFSEAFYSLADASHYRMWYSMLIAILLKLQAAISANTWPSAVDHLIRMKIVLRPLDQRIINCNQMSRVRFPRQISPARRPKILFIRESPSGQGRAGKAPSEKMWVETEEIDT